VKGNRKVRSTLGALKCAEQRTNQLEDQLSIRERWDSASSDYREVQKDMAQRNYRRALDELERLVVQRLFELTKLNLSGTGMYHFRCHICANIYFRL